VVEDRWCRVDAGLVQDLPDRRRGDLHAQHEQFAVHTSVAPAAVFGREAQHQGPDRVGRAGPARSFGAAGARVAAGDQVAVPAQDRVGTDQQPQLA
jgi:hypothetical protein